MPDIPFLPEQIEAALPIPGVMDMAWGPASELSGAILSGKLEPNFLDFSGDIFGDRLKDNQDVPACAAFLEQCLRAGGSMGLLMGCRLLSYLTRMMMQQQLEGAGGMDEEAGYPAGGGDTGYSGASSGSSSARSGRPHGTRVASTFTGPLSSDFQKRVQQIAEADVGRQLWADTEFAGACQGGNVGCAASVTEVLRESGVDYASSASVVELAGQLQSGGWQDVGGAESAQPGDVIYGNGGGDHQHIGIVGVDANGQLVIYNNWSSDGQWHAEPINQCSILTDYGPGQIHVLRAPTK